MNVVKFQDTNTKTFHSVFNVRGRAKTARSTTMCGKATADMRRVADFDIGDERGSHHFTAGCDRCIAGVTAMFDLMGEMV